MRSLRLLWMALILVLVVPLYGQVSCNRSCPPSPNPCQVAAGRSIETGQCVYSDVDGAACDAGGVTGVCSEGQCIATECTGVATYDLCNTPVGGGGVGACVEEVCVDAAPDDECVRVGVGRINCCSQEGCKVANGAYCTKPLEDGTPCDPTGVEPADQPLQDGSCENGTCVAQTGACAGLVCRTSAGDPCVRNYCDPGPAECDEWPIELFSYSGCVGAQGLDGVCSGGGCIPYEDPLKCGAVNGVGGVVCDDGNSCTRNDCVEGSCVYPPLVTGAGCLDGESGQCFNGNCQPVFLPCGNDDDCEDGNPCTVNECDPFGNLCGSLTLDDDTPCLGGQGLCRSGVCLPNLCIGRDCSDGNSCTDDVCYAPYGVCSNPTKANGQPCDGEPGECIFGNCALGACTSDADCDDENSCTVDDCDPFGGLCSNNGLPSGSPCTTSGGASGECRFGRCQPVFGGF